MDFALRCAFAHGTGALRTHIDSYPKQTAISWGVFAEMREQWKGRIALQAVALFPIDRALTDEAEFRFTVETVAKHGGVLGGLTFLGEAPGPRSDAMLDRAVRGRERERPRSRFPRRRERFTQRALARADRRRRAAPQVQGPHRRRALLLARARRRQRARRDHREGGAKPASRSSRCRCATCICRTASPAARRAGAASRRCTSSMPPASP